MSNEVDQYLRTALPKKRDRHFLLLGEFHDLHPSHTDYLADHLETLVSECNLRTLSFEGAFSREVFLWAYEDGLLPVPPNQAVRYLENIFKATALHEATAPSEVRLRTKAAALGVATIDSDARRGFFQHDPQIQAIFQESLDALDAQFKAHPELLERLRTEPDSVRHWVERRPPFDALPPVPLTGNFVKMENDPVAMLEYAKIIFFKHELAQLLPHKDYAQRLDNVAAVVDAARAFPLETDAISAVLMAHRARHGGNGVHIAGAGHIMGSGMQPVLAKVSARHAGEAADGTLADSLRYMNMPVRTAIMSDRAQLSDTIRPWFAPGGPLHPEKPEKGTTLTLPDFLESDGEKVHRPRQEPGMRANADDKNHLQRFLRSEQATTLLGAVPSR